jgi:DUF971 family protein
MTIGSLKSMSDIWPTELRVSKDRHTLNVTFSDGAAYPLSAETMRVLSPSAEVQGHGPGQQVTVPGKRNVGIAAITPAGNYAVRIRFDDGHDSGIFTWPYLRELWPKRVCRAIRRNGRGDHTGSRLSSRTSDCRVTISRSIDSAIAMH